MIFGRTIEETNTYVQRKNVGSGNFLSQAAVGDAVGFFYSAAFSICRHNKHSIKGYQILIVMFLARMVQKLRSSYLM